MTDGQKEILLATPLFCGIAAADAEVLLACLAPTLRHVSRDGMVLTAGDAPRFVGVLLAGRLSDKLGSLHPAWRMAMQGFGLLAAVPFIVLMGNSVTLWVIYVGFAGFGFARAFFDGNTYTVLYDVILPRYHSSASGVMIMTGFAIGALAPLVLGMVKQAAGLSFGISMLAVVWLVCGAVMLLGAKYFYMKDYNKIRHE